MKVLIVSYYFPPLNSIASHRPYSWAKYWSRAGHEICVLTTPKNPANGSLDLEIEPEVAKSVRVDEVPFWPTGRHASSTNRSIGSKAANRSRKWVKAKIRDLRHSLTGALLDTRFFWVRPAIQHALELYKEFPYDLVVSSYSPPAVHLIGSALAKKLGVLWVADYRDLWSDNPVERGFGPFAWFQKRLENQTLTPAVLITTASPMFKEDLEQRFSQTVLLVENGFDTNMYIDEANPFLDDQKIRLVHTGTIHPNQSNFNPLFQVIKELKVQNPHLHEYLEVLFYGLDNLIVERLAKVYAIDDIVRQIWICAL
jgi:glycosyltransferase involved in cell wall biosynthesis